MDLSKTRKGVKDWGARAHWQILIHIDIFPTSGRGIKMPKYNHQRRHLLRHLLRGHVAEKVTGRTSPGEGSARERGCHLVYWRATFIH